MLLSGYFAQDRPVDQKVGSWVRKDALVDVSAVVVETGFLQGLPQRTRRSSPMEGYAYRARPGSNDSEIRHRLTY
jgi:hypothetical protein